MTMPRRLAKYLKKHHIQYDVIEHVPAYTSLETASVGHVLPASMAKVVMVKADERDVMLVLPADHTVDWLKLSAMLETRDIRCEKEEEFTGIFPDVEPGAMPPFGSLYAIPCFIDQSLFKGDWVTFSAGNHRQCLRVWTDDFARITKARRGDFAVSGAPLLAEC
jgi:Ala-tRNA(Pro) deacylase